MATFSVDANGQRIKTDILVSGYMRQFDEKHKLFIPIDINKVCFQYWLIPVCDEWDRKLSFNNIHIDGQIMKSAAKRGQPQSIYGCLGVDKGSHTWQIKLRSNASWFTIGIIQDKHEILTKFKNSYDYVVNNGCCLLCTGRFYKGGTDIASAFKYCTFPKGTVEGMVITMTLDMDNHTLSYKINGDDNGIATDEIDKTKYRLVVGVWYKNDSVELL